jgi:DNA modification methylase
MEIKPDRIYCIDVLKGLGQLPDNFIDCIVTSPPYWNLRDYDIKDQMGLEQDPDDFINKLVEIMKECKRVLKPTGTIWLNLGDSYHKNLSGRKKVNPNWFQPKQRLLIPYRTAIKCQDELGLILRNDITWVKQLCNYRTKDSFGSCMPTAVRDRLNTTSESLFFFVKDPRYYFSLDSIRIPYKTKCLGLKKISQRDGRGVYADERRKLNPNPKGKIPGDCIMFPLEPSKERHFAMFPQTLPELCISAGCPEQVCKKCGMPRLIIKAGKNPYSFNFRVRDVKKGRIKHIDRKASEKEIKSYNEKEYVSRKKEKIVLGCNCRAGYRPGIVLDPFMGSGTTAIVAKKLGRNFIGFDLNRDYIKIANRRVSEINNGN